QKDIEKALYHYSISAELGQTFAMRHMGAIMCEGHTGFWGRFKGYYLRTKGVILALTHIIKNAKYGGAGPYVTIG
ncbi:hypothetical protein, partial [Solemya elarraichensis gill symbiont]